MAAPICEKVKYRQILGKGDTLHDFCDRDRIRDKLNYGIEQNIISSGINATAAANTICNKVESLLHVDTCGIPSYNENELLKFFYGDKSIVAIEEAIQINYFPKTPKQHIEYQIPYKDIPSFIEKLNTTSSGKYVMDYTYLSPFLCGHGINTIGKAYDRTTVNEADECNEKPIIESQSVLKKEEGELFFFNEIKIKDDMKLEWNVGSIYGIIDIRKMMEVKSGIGLENLTTAILAFYQAIQTTPTKLLYESNDIIKKCYGLDLFQFNNLNEYLLALTDLKRMGDLLQVKLAKLLGYTFVSNDRMAILLSAIGYENPSIRTSKTPSGDERSDRIVALYNFNKDEMNKKLETYYESIIKEYIEYIKYLRIITTYLRENKQHVNNLYSFCQDILKKLLPITTLDPRIRATDILSGQRIPRRYNPQWLNRDIIIKRGLYVYIKYFSVVLNILNIISSYDFSKIIQEFNVIIDERTTSVVKSNKLKNLFIKENIPLPNTLFKTVDGTVIKSSLDNLYTFINTIYNFLINTDEIEKIMNQNLPMPLFGEPIEYYKKLIVRIFKDLKNTNLNVNINNLEYKIGASSNPEKIIESIIDLEQYFAELIAPYNFQQGGRRKKISKSKRTKKGGQSMEIDESSSLIPPDDIIDQTITKLVASIYEADIKGQMDISLQLFISYMQLQLISQQFNLSLSIVGVEKQFTILSPTASPPIREYTKSLEQLSSSPEPFAPPTPSKYDYLPSSSPMDISSGGSKKKPVNKGKSKNEEVKKAKKPTEKKKSK